MIRCRQMSNILLVNISELKCAVHPMLQFAPEADKVLSKIKKDKAINLNKVVPRGTSMS